METEEHFITVNKTTRYYTNIPSDQASVGRIENVLIVIHGYAQLAKDFLNDFKFLSQDSILIVAPEGLSKFYSKNVVGASWMTKEDRLNEINDYVNYLDRVYDDLQSRFDLSSAKFNLLGFSQGVHTAVRWFIKSIYHFRNLILCSSDFPKDAEFETLKSKLSKLRDSRMYWLSGKNDKIISREIFDMSIEVLKANQIDFEEIIFEGGHEIHIKSISDILNK